MHWKPVNHIDSIKEIETEIEQLKKQSPNFKNNLVWIIPLILLSFILPFFPNRTGARPLIESVGYWPGVLVCLAILTVVSIYIDHQEKQQRENRLTELNLRKTILKKRMNNDEI
jgi:MFS superfamily sulfate permease-like transporter